ncbi:methionine ABC transporter ATP-binding protein [Terribacillus saccharophilus]|uniref:methionine ABC transporter ATP-binding protein n=1 Tax=Terribacillus saccharophilus TaxID=361277 RepID=UPI002989FA57|nr:methionine ABC transporter ATP-binding protein [Terribacillus saccharophilus]MCM3225504.1 methionine ABC transporter ATP-binding protein [Terribacillus saccharophilus]
MIELKNVSKTFTTGKKKVEALKDVSLKINKGEIYGVIGFSGAGKSTLIRCANLLERPTEGEVFIDGVDLTKLKKWQLRKARGKIGMIFQHFNLLTTATVYENVARPLKLSKVPKHEIKERVDKYLKIVGLEEKKNVYPAQLSGGQKQRVAIARALAQEPEVLLSDEATSALDPNTTSSILELLLRVNKELGITIFLITHELDVIQRICDRVGVMHHGELVEEGSVIDVFTKPQHPQTRKFVFDDANFQVPDSVKKGLSATGRLVSLTFIGEASNEPFLAAITKKFEVVPSILAGGIDQLKASSVGKLLIHLQGDPAEVKKAISYLESQHVTVEEVAS